MSDTQKLDAILQEMKKFNSQSKTSHQSSSGFSTADAKNMKKTIDELLDGLRESIKLKSKESNKQQDFINAQERFAKMLRNDAKDASSFAKLQQRQMNALYKQMDMFGGSVDLMNKKAKQLADMAKSSSSSMGKMFDGFDGGIRDMQETINDFISLRKHFAETRRDMAREFADSRKLEAEARRNFLAEISNKKQNSAKNINDLASVKQRIKKLKTSSNPNNKAKIAALQDERKALIDAVRNNRREINGASGKLSQISASESGKRSTLKKDRTQVIAVVGEIDKLINSFGDFGQEIFNSKKLVNVWGKELDKSRSKLKDWATETLTLVGGFKLLKDGAFQISDQYRLIADAGMAGAMTTFASTALKLNLTVSQLSRVIGENRAAFAKSGLSINQFGDIAKSNVKSLQDIGLSNEQAASAQAKMVAGSAAALGADQKTSSDLIKKSIDDQVKAFRMLSVATGDTIDALAAEYDSLLRDEELSKQLQSLNGKERQNRSQEMLADLTHYKLLGLTNDQIRNELRLKQASSFRLSDRYTGSAQMSVLGNLLGMDADATSRFNDLTKSGKKLSQTEQAFVDQYKAEIANRVNSEQQNNPNGGKNEAIQSSIAAMGEYAKALFSSGQNLSSAQSKGDAQMSIADANKALISSQGAGVDKIVAAYEKQSKLIQRLMAQANPSNDGMAVVGRSTENFRNFMDSFKDTPFWAAGKMLLGAAIMLIAAAKMMSKSNSSLIDDITRFGKGRGKRALGGGRRGAIFGRGMSHAGTRLATRIGGKGAGSAIRGLTKVGLRGLPIVGALAGLAFNAKDIYDATNESNPKAKTEALTKSISSTVGSIIGGALGAAFGGPIGLVIGGIVGDTLGGLVGDIINWTKTNYSRNPFVKTAVDTGYLIFVKPFELLLTSIKKGSEFISWSFKESTWMIGTIYDIVVGGLSNIGTIVYDAVKDTAIFKYLSKASSYITDAYAGYKQWFGKNITPIVSSLKNLNPFDWMTGMCDSLLDGYYRFKKWIIGLKSKIPGGLNAEDQNALKFIDDREKNRAAAAQPQTSPPASPVKASSASPQASPVKASSASPQAQQSPQGDAYLNSILAFTGNTGDLAHFKRLDPSLQQKIISYAAAYNKATGKKLSVTSAFRSGAEQQSLRASHPGAAAAPGTSMHEKGMAVDISPNSIRAANSAGINMESYGLWQPLKNRKGEFQHIQAAGVAANSGQAKALGITAPSQVSPSSMPQTSVTVPALTPDILGSGQNNPVLGPNGPIQNPFGGNSSYGTSDVVALLKKIAGLNSEQLSELRNLVSSSRASKMISEKDQVKTF